MADNQYYDLTLVLKVPQSPINDQLGNFMVHTTLKSCTHETLYETRMSALLPYQSTRMRWLMFIKYLIPLYFLWTDESVIVEVPLLQNVFDRKDLSISEAIIEVQSSATCGSGIQIESAALKVDAQFTYLR